MLIVKCKLLCPRWEKNACLVSPLHTNPDILAVSISVRFKHRTSYNHQQNSKRICLDFVDKVLSGLQRVKYLTLPTNLSYSVQS
eukprot:jgi/Botrbrau1/5497/Bobra.27_1s0034.1